MNRRAPEFKTGVNPRKTFGRKYRERGPTKYCFNRTDIARAARISLRTLYEFTRTRVEGPKLDPSNLAALALFIVGQGHLDSKLIVRGADFLDKLAVDRKWEHYSTRDLEMLHTLSTHLRSLAGTCGAGVQGGPRGPSKQGTNKGKKYRIHYEVIDPKGQVIGCTESREHVLDEEPRAGFRRVSKSRCPSCDLERPTQLGSGAVLL